MNTERNGAQLNVTLEGPIGETTPLFNLPLEGVQELNLEMSKVTYINSIGVRHWILWTLKIPKDCKVDLIEAPFVFASQANTVLGFMSERMFFRSIRVPYACEECGAEEMYTAVRGTDFEYSTAGHPPRVSLPLEKPCLKCTAGKLEQDFVMEKTFAFVK